MFIKNTRTNSGWEGGENVQEEEDEKNKRLLLVTMHEAEASLCSSHYAQ